MWKLMYFKNWPIYGAIVAAALLGLVLWGLSALQKSNHVQQLSPTAPLAMEPAPNDERPSAKPSSVAEWAAVQKFVESTWLVASRQAQAQEMLKKTVARLAPKADLHGVDAAFVTHMSHLEDALTALDGVHTPEVANTDTEKFIADASEAVNAMLVLEMEQTNWFIKGWDESSRTPPEEVVISINNDINRNSAFLVLSLHRIYWNYGYSDEDIDERTLKLKVNAMPRPTVSFSRENL